MTEGAERARAVHHLRTRASEANARRRDAPKGSAARIRAAAQAAILWRVAVELEQCEHLPPEAGMDGVGH